MFSALGLGVALFVVKITVIIINRKNDFVTGAICVAKAFIEFVLGSLHPAFVTIVVLANIPFYVNPVGRQAGVFFSLNI